MNTIAENMTNKHSMKSKGLGESCLMKEKAKRYVHTKVEILDVKIIAGTTLDTAVPRHFASAKSVE